MKKGYKEGGGSL